MTNLVMVLALTLYGEARGESLAGKEAVASVIWWRAEGKPWKMMDACLEPRQFSCWNKSQRPQPFNAWMPDVDTRSQAWAECVTIAKKMAIQRFEPTVKATHYHAIYIKPGWRKAMRFVKSLGKHKFYWSRQRDERKS